MLHASVSAVQSGAEDVPPRAEGEGARLTISTDAVVRNWQQLDGLSRGECGAVLKADAYGLGLAAVAPALARAGCRSFFTALESDGLALRALLPDATIYVLNGLFGDPSRAVAARLIPFISSREALAEWPDAPFALNIDTGMNRLGMTPSEAFEVTRRPALLASHFACADTPSHPQNREQEAVFAEAAAQFAGVPASLANSAATLTRPEAHYALNRPGIALYGGAALEGRPPLEPAVRVEARVIQVREVKAGAPVGYGAAETVKRDSRLAVVSAGYADGYLRAAGGRDDKPGAKALVGGIEVPLVGRVSMDLITIDVTDAHCQRGDYVELFGPGLPLRDVASAAGTIGYEFLTALSRRAERRYAPL